MPGKEARMTDPTRVAVKGPLAQYARGFRDALLSQGYAALSTRNLLHVLAHLSRWMRDHRIEPVQLTPLRVEQYLRARRRAGYTAWLSVRALRSPLGYLRHVGAVPEPAPRVALTALDRLMERYDSYLLHERGLSAVTVSFRQLVARQFLADYARPDRLELDRLTSADVTGFVLSQSRRRSVASTKGVVTALRSLLGFLFMEGLTTTPLAAAAPAVAGWRVSGLPRGLEPADLARLLRGCDRRTTVGRRNYAILCLLVRLGLRRCEVAALELDDIDWRHGEIRVRGKGQRHERMPLPADVGEALVAYIRHRHGSTACRSVFLRCCAPRGRLSSTAISMAVSQLSVGAGLPAMGPHRLRYTAATQMLGHGASLPEVAEVLRHRSLLTTAIYAKVDRGSLRTLARRWPGVGR